MPISPSVKDTLAKSPTTVQEIPQRTHPSTDTLGPLPMGPGPVIRPKKESLNKLAQEGLPKMTYQPVRAAKLPPTEKFIPIGPGESSTVANIPIHVRVEQEKKRLSLVGSKEEPSGVKTTAHSIRFRDAQGRNIRYALRPSQKKTCATWLELSIEGESPRKVRALVYDETRHCLMDKKTKVHVPPNDAILVMKSLKLLCKISMVRLDCSSGAQQPGMRKVQSELDFGSVTRMKRNAYSTNSLTNSLTHGRDMIRT